MTAKATALENSDIHVAAEYFSDAPYAEGAEGERRLLDTARAEGVFIIRESTKKHIDQFESMRSQTYRNAQHIPAVEAIRQVGLVPLFEDEFEVQQLNPDGSTEAVLVHVEEIRESDTTARLFQYGGYWHLWAQSSAAKEVEVGNENYVNPFTTLLIDTIRTHRPKVVFAATPSRLTRSISQAHLFLANLARNVDHICIANQRFDLTGPFAPMSYMFLNFLFWAAAQERDAIVGRMATGRIGGINAGRWPIGQVSVPLGHTLTENRELIVQPGAKELVREMMLTLSADVPDRLKVDILSDLGVTNRNGPIGATANPTGAINALFSWAPLWISGEYLWRHEGDYSGVEVLAGTPVSRRDEKDPGELQMLVRVEPLPGGWAEPEVLRHFETAARNRSANTKLNAKEPRPVHDTIKDQSRDWGLLASIKPAQYMAGVDAATVSARAGSRAKGTISTFAGRTWTDKAHHYEIRILGDMYAVRRRLRSEAPGGFTVAQFTREQLHRDMLPALAAALREGVDGILKPDYKLFASAHTMRIADNRLATIDALRKRAGDARARAATALSNSQDPDIDEHQRRALMASDRKLRGDADAADAKAADLQRQQPSVNLAAETFDATTDVWLPALASLHGRDRVSQEVHRALQVVLTDFRLTRSGALWTGSVKLNLNTAHGIAVLGPITWRIGPGGLGTPDLAERHIKARHTTIVERAILAETLRVTCGLPRATADLICRSPFTELGHIIAHKLCEHPVPDWVGAQWRHPAFMEWVTNIYSDPKFVWGPQVSTTRPLRQLAANLVAQRGRVTGSELLEELAPVSLRFTHYLAHRQPTDGVLVSPRQPSVQSSGESSFAKRVLTPFRCKEGHAARIVTLIPEVVTDLLCECGQMAGVADIGYPADLVFPDEYQLLLAPELECREHAAIEQRIKLERPLAPLPQGVVDVLEAHGPMQLGGIKAALIDAGVARPTMGKQQIGYAVNTLRRQGRVRPLNEVGWPVWALTRAGRERVTRLKQ